MENYIVINGKKAELTEEQLKKLGIEVKDDPFERIEYKKKYYFIAGDGEVTSANDYKNVHDNCFYNAGNYCRDRKIMEQRALHETLNRLLERFSMQNGGDKIDWNNLDTEKFYIYFDFEFYTFGANEVYETKGINPYFISRKVAERAIEEIIKPFMKEHPEFVW